jgi:hypothetical protein
VLRSFEKPQGTPRPGWPDWVKESHPSGADRVPGCRHFLGDPEFDEPVPRQLLQFHDFEITPEDIRNKSIALREAIGRYLPPAEFEVFMGLFVDGYDLLGNQTNIRASLKNIYTQFNVREPKLGVFPEAIVRERLVDTEAEDLRTYLVLSDTRFRAVDYPELVVALALFQAAHVTYLKNLRAVAERSEASEEELGNMQLLFDTHFRVFGEFLIYSVFMPLVILQHDDIIREGETSGQEAMTRAISQAWEIFFRKRLLRTNFKSTAGARMICPANHHLRHSRERRWIEGLYQFVVDNRHDPPMERLCDDSRIIVTQATHQPEYYYWDRQTRDLARAKHIRGGKGVELESLGQE